VPKRFKRKGVFGAFSVGEQALLQTLHDGETKTMSRNIVDAHKSIKLIDP
jgi:hypothetical protein